MTTARTLALTDDEAAALALRASGSWRVPLPTVDDTDELDLAAAILRGRRSLAVRDLANPDGTVTGEAARVLAALDGGPRAVFLLVDAREEWCPSGLTVYLYGDSAGQAKMSHVVTAAGVHYFRVGPPPGQWLALTELAEAVFKDGFADAEDGVRQPAAAILSVVGPEGPRRLRVTVGQVTGIRDPLPATFATVAEGIGWLTS